MVKLVIDADATPQQRTYYQDHMLEAVRRAQVIVLEWSQIVIGLNKDNGYLLMSQIAQAILDEGYRNSVTDAPWPHIDTTYQKEVQ